MLLCGLSTAVGPEHADAGAPTVAGQYTSPRYEVFSSVAHLLNLDLDTVFETQHDSVLLH
jgi:hypothetical protein